MSERFICTKLRVGAVLLVAGSGLAMVPAFAQTKSESAPSKPTTPMTTTARHAQPAGAQATLPTVRQSQTAVPHTTVARAPSAARQKAGSAPADDGGIQGAPCPNPAHSCCATGTAGCDDEVCCDMICSIDPFCCNNSWDTICVGEANSFCEVCGGTPPVCGDGVCTAPFEDVFNCEVDCAGPPCDPPTPNDSCLTPTELGLLAAGDSAVAAGTMVCATFDCGLLAAGTGEAWLTFELAEAGPVSIEYCGSTGVWGNAYIVLTGACPCDVLTFFQSFAFSCPDGNLQITWPIIPAGVWYYPILHDPGFGATGDYVITVTAVPPPPPCDPPVPNDSCTTPTDAGLLAPGDSAVIAGTMACATFDCGQLAAGTGEAWLTFELTADAPVSIEYCGSTGVWGNAYIVLTSACPCDFLTFFSSFAFSCPDGNLQINWPTLSAGIVWYYPILHDPNFGASGDYVITVTAIGPPPNDDCADRLPISEVCDMPFSTLGATTDGPPDAACVPVGQDIWFNYTASCTGDVTVSLCGSSYDTNVAVYDTCDCLGVGDGTLLACNDDFCGLSSQVSFPAIAGECYKIRLGGFSTASGNGVLSVINSGVPCNGGGDCPTDLDGDGQTGVSDLIELISNWGFCP